jgi:hypothetical protein
MLPPLLATLEFRSNNERHRPVIRALELLKKYADKKLRTFPPEEDVPIDGVVRSLWREAVEEEDKDGTPRINRITYEICALEALRDQLRSKEIWVVGGNQGLPKNPHVKLLAKGNGWISATVGRAA